VGWQGLDAGASPNPGGASGPNRLSGVAATSASNAWAVGFYPTAGAVGRTLVVRWNGTRWAQVPSPNPGGASGTNRLSGVAATSASNAWAVGTYVNGGAYRTLTLHWDGKAWTKVPSPNAGSGNNTLLGVAATSATNAWAVGYYAGPTATRTILEHWDGKSWTMISGPNPGASGSTLSGVAATSASDAWAVGFYVNGTGVSLGLLEHWTGTSWKQVPSPSPGSSTNARYGVAATSASNAWAVGNS